MNDDREVISNGYVEILGDRIKSITSFPPTGVNIITTGGLIFPGLIDAHNHPRFNILDVIPFSGIFTDDLPPSEIGVYTSPTYAPFQNRYEWQNTVLMDDFRSQIAFIRNYGGSNANVPNIIKAAEVRALVSGTTSIQGLSDINQHAQDSYAHVGIGIHNVERFPGLIISETYPLSESLAYWEGKRNEYWRRFVIHLSEGIDSEALQEFYSWRDMGMLDSRTSIIHGIPYGEPEWSLLSSAGGSLIWSPSSNLRLYGATADIPQAVFIGVNVALAPDWTESGTASILQELKWADAVNEQLWSNELTAMNLAEFVTRNAALALGMESYAGQISSDYRADIMVIVYGEGTEYEDLVNATPADVILTVVSGMPVYGDSTVMDQFQFLPESETIVVESVQKDLVIQIQAEGIPQSGKLLSEIEADLTAAYAASNQSPCEYLPILP